MFDGSTAAMSVIGKSSPVFHCFMRLHCTESGWLDNYTRKYLYLLVPFLWITGACVLDSWQWQYDFMFPYCYPSQKEAMRKATPSRTGSIGARITTAMKSGASKQCLAAPKVSDLLLLPLALDKEHGPSLLKETRPERTNFVQQ